MARLETSPCGRAALGGQWGQGPVPGGEKVPAGVRVSSPRTRGSERYQVWFPGVTDVCSVSENALQSRPWGACVPCSHRLWTQ